MSINAPELDVIVPIYKNAPLVRDCVSSLLAHFDEITSFHPRLVLINDSPDDKDIEDLFAEYKAAKQEIVLLRNQANIGFVGSVNRGLDLARKDARNVILVNSDTITFPGTLSELMSSASADHQIGFASPRSNNASICSLPHFYGGSLPTPLESYKRWMELSRTMPAFHFSPTSVGFYMFISHQVIANHGGLSSEFGVGYEEENDLVMRAGKVGTRAIIVNRSFAYHAGSASFNLKDLDLGSHKQKNLTKLVRHHPEFLRLVSRYEGSAHYRAERILAGMLKDSDGRTKMVFDLSGMGKHYNGTNELAVGTIRSMALRQSHRVRLSVIAPAESFVSHGLNEIPGLNREEPGAPGLHGIAVRLGQPFDLHHVNTLESTAAINVYAMLDTISEDSGPLAVDGGFIELWDHVAEYASGLLFISRFSEDTFCKRHRAALKLPRWASLLPTRADSYPKQRATSERTHLLVVGNHFAHKGSDDAARVIASALPTIKVVALGSETSQSANLSSYRAGGLDPVTVDRFFSDASVVVLPSHVEGFGFGFMHSLAAGRPVVARRIPATEEILETLNDVSGVFLFEDNTELIRACNLALRCESSSATYDRALSWDNWGDGLTTFCLSLIEKDDLFERLVSRIKHGDLLRRAFRGDAMMRDAQQGANAASKVGLNGQAAKSVDLEALLNLEGTEFVEHAYATLLCRPADEEGLRAYLKELKSGQHKLELLDALCKSSEGRERDVTLAGLDAMVDKYRKSRRSLVGKIFGS